MHRYHNACNKAVDNHKSKEEDEILPHKVHLVRLLSPTADIAENAKMYLKAYSTFGTF